MGLNPRRIAHFVVCACILAACGSEPPFTGSSAEVSAADRQAAIPLEEALQQGLLQVITRDHNSTRTQMGLVLEPKTRAQPWIRIDAGWQAVDPDQPGRVYVTTQTKYARLDKRKNLLITIPHVQRTLFRASGIPTGATLCRCDDERLQKFLTAINKHQTFPEWKEVQVATWMLTENVTFAAVRVPPNDGRIRLQTHATVSSAEILKTVALLEQIGHDKEDFALWVGALDEVDRLIGIYEDLVDTDHRAALVPFKYLCDLYPLESAADVLIGSFDLHSGQKGTAYRRHAFEVLRRIGGTTEINLIKRYAALESNDRLADAMAATVSAAAAPGR